MLLLDEHPSVDGYIDGPHLVILKCPYCGEKHFHGSSGGTYKIGELTPRGSHCESSAKTNWKMPHNGDYLIRVIEPPKGVRLHYR